MIINELARIQKELKAPKNLYNKFGNYKYRNAEGILESVKPLLNGLAIIINDEPIRIGDRYYIKATVTLTNGEESVSAEAYAREDETKKGMDGCQITGACSSYARKYALNALLMIDDSKDSDDDSLSPKNPANQETEKEEPMHISKPVSKVKVTTSSTMPTNPVSDYLMKSIGEMKRDIADFNFGRMRSALIDGGIVPDVASDVMTMEQAVQLVEAIYANFKKEDA